MSRRFFHSLCVFLLLIAQQGALVHATWHASSNAHALGLYNTTQPGQADQHSPDKQNSQGSLCAFDLAFGQTLGGVHGSSAPQVAVAHAPERCVQPYIPRTSSESVPALSRGPPPLL